MFTKDADVVVVFLVGSLMMVVFVVFFILFFRMYDRKRRKYIEDMHALEISRQRDLMEATITTQENERKYFAEELHDSLGQMLSAIRIKASTTRERIMKEAEPRDDLALQLNEIKKLSTDSLNEVRVISRKLLPVVLKDFGLTEAVSELCIGTQDASAIQITFDPGNEEMKLSSDAELAVYRILQELLNNMIKHAEATAVKILFSKKENNWCVDYDDNGKGFDPAILKGSGLGLKNLESRTQILNGSLKISSAPGEGVRVEICIPF